jgi:hypothetical protein
VMAASPISSNSAAGNSRIPYTKASFAIVSPRKRQA